MAPRFLMTGIHLAGALVATGLLLNAQPPSIRHAALIACLWVYFVRFLVTTFYLLRRRVEWAEAGTVGVWILGLDVLLAYLGARSAVPWRLADSVAVLLYALGSFINTGSEVQRAAWKAKSESRGHLYTKGLFSLSMHVNYFGDLMLFTGFSILAGSVWALLLPVVMAASFVFGHIPRLDAHLREKYGDEFREWERGTRRFVPFVY